MMLTQKQRMKRAIKAAGLSLALALGCLFIPILHFVLTPAFLLLSIILFIRIYRQSLHVLIKSGALCPHCQSALPEQSFYIAPSTVAISFYCPNCRGQIRLPTPKQEQLA